MQMLGFERFSQSKGRGVIGDINKPELQLFCFLYVYNF